VEPSTSESKNILSGGSSQEIEHGGSTRKGEILWIKSERREPKKPGKKSEKGSPYTSQPTRRRLADGGAAGDGRTGKKVLWERCPNRKLKNGGPKRKCSKRDKGKMVELPNKKSRIGGGGGGGGVGGGGGWNHSETGMGKNDRGTACLSGIEGEFRERQGSPRRRSPEALQKSTVSEI